MAFQLLRKQEQYIRGLLSDKAAGNSLQITAAYDLHTVETRKSLWKDLQDIDTTTSHKSCVLETLKH